MTETRPLTSWRIVQALGKQRYLCLSLLAFLFVVVHGAGYGVTSITRPVVTAEHLGRDGFGAISGAQATMFVGATALSPTAAALLWEAGGYDLALLVSGALVAAGFSSFVLAARLPRGG